MAAAAQRNSPHAARRTSIRYAITLIGYLPGVNLAGLHARRGGDHDCLLSAEGVTSGERLAEDELVHLRCALVGQHRFQVDHVPDNRVFQRYPVAAQYGSGGPADFDRLTRVI